MSRHQAVRNLDYEAELEDEYGPYSDEEDELSPEDQVRMTEGTAQVLEALGPEAPKVTKAQIEESLYYYYFDVDKTIAYLISKYIDPPKKPAKAAPPKAAPKQDGKSTPVHHHSFPYEERVKCRCQRTQGTCILGQGSGPWWPTSLRRSYPVALREPSLTTSCQAAIASGSASRESFAHLFRDLPWGNVPPERQALLIPPPRLPGGLLGGSGAPPKMSKLQQLAAARKKKAEEQKSASEDVEQTQVKMEELTVNDNQASKENRPLAGLFGKRVKTSETTAQGRIPLTMAEPTRPESTPAQAPEVAPSLQQEAVLPEPEPVLAPPKANPSAFASTLFGPSSDIPNRKPREVFTLPYMAMTWYTPETFDKPSPDDVVLAAQAKGSLTVKKQH